MEDVTVSVERFPPADWRPVEGIRFWVRSLHVAGEDVQTLCAEKIGSEEIVYAVVLGEYADAVAALRKRIVEKGWIE